MSATCALIALFMAMQAVAPQPPPRPPGVGTRAELEDRAATETASRAVRNGRVRTPDEIRQSAHFIADCAINREPDQSRTIVLTPLSAGEVLERYPEVIPTQCFTGDFADLAMSFPFPTLHTTFADALIRHDFSETGPTNFSSLPALNPVTAPPAATVEELADLTERQRTSRLAFDRDVAAWGALQRLGECIARRGGDDVRKLAATMPATPEERAQLAVLQPMIAACLPPGTTVRLRPADVRGGAVLAYYRLAIAAGHHPQSTTEAPQ